MTLGSTCAVIDAIIDNVTYRSKAMPVIDADTIRKLVLTNNELFVPDRITKAIGQSVTSSAKDVSGEISRLAALYKQYVTSDEPTPVDYSDEGSVPKVVEKGTGISYPTCPPYKTLAGG